LDEGGDGKQDQEGATSCRLAAYDASYFLDAENIDFSHKYLSTSAKYYCPLVAYDPDFPLQ
jgi:hypothetical protein